MRLITSIMVSDSWYTHTVGRGQHDIGQNHNGNCLAPYSACLNAFVAWGTPSPEPKTLSPQGFGVEGFSTKGLQSEALMYPGHLIGSCKGVVLVG